MTSTRFPRLDSQTAPNAARPILSASEAHFGFLPSPVAKAARSPLLLKQLLGGLTAFDNSSLSAVEQEVVAMTVAFENECHYCMALHSAKLAREPAQAELLAQLRAGSELTEPRLQALRLFVLAVLRERGAVQGATWARLFEAGYSEQQALDALQGTGAYWLSTITNTLLEVELDAPFVPFAWQKPGSERA